MGKKGVEKLAFCGAFVCLALSLRGLIGVTNEKTQCLEGEIETWRG